MTRDKEITGIIDQLLEKKRFHGIDREKVRALFERAEFRAPSAEVRLDLQRIREEALARSKGRILPFGLNPGRRMFAAAAACGILVIGAMLLWNYVRPDRAMESVQCTFAVGDVRMQRDGETHSLAAGAVVNTGDVIITGDRSFADLVYADDIRIRLKEKSTLRIADLAREGGLNFKVELAVGKALLDFKKLSRGDRAGIHTPTSVAGVRGTRFGVFVREDRSVRYEVLEGKIAVSNRVVLEEGLMRKEEVRELVNRLDEALEEKAVVVGANQVCDVDSRRNEELAKTVEAMINKTEPDAMPEKNIAINPAVEAAAPRVYSEKAAAPVMMKELRGFAETAHSVPAGEAAINVTIIVEPVEALIRVDGKDLGAGRVSIMMQPGTHAVEASAPGFETRKMEMEFTGENSRLALKLDRLAGAAFDYAHWMDITRPSFILTDRRMPIFISVDRGGRVDALMNGKPLWNYRGRGEIGSFPVIDGERMYITSGENSISTLSLRNGALLWNRRIEGGLHFGARLLVAGEFIFAGTAAGNLYKFDKAGREIWKMSLPAGIYATPAAAANLVFVPVQDGNIYAVDAIQHTVVKKIAVGRIVGSSVLAGDNRLFAASFDGRVVCYDYARDEMVWQYKTGDRIITDLVAEGGQLYVTTAGGEVIRLSDSGKPVWKLNVGGTIERNPVLEGAHLYVLARNAFYVIDRGSGQVRWSFVLPSESSSNLAFTGNNAYFGTREKGIISVKK